MSHSEAPIGSDLLVFPHMLPAKLQTQISRDEGFVD